MVGTVGRYYLHRTTGQTGLFWPVFPLFLLSRGVTFAGIGTLLAVQAGTTLLAEIPSGVVGDKVGRRNALVLGSLSVLAAEVGFVVADGFIEFVGVYVAFGFGRAMRSGSGDAWLYDALLERGTSDRFTAVRGRGESATHWASAVCMLASGVLFFVDPTAPFLAAAGLTAVNAAVLATLPPVGDGTDRQTDVPVREVLPLARKTVTAPALRKVIVVAAAFFAIERSVTEFIPTVTTAVVDTSTLLRGVTGDPTVVEVLSVGVLFAALTATSAVAGRFAGRVEQSVGAVVGVVAAGVLSALVLAGAVVSPWVAVCGFVLVKTADALVRPLITGYVNERIRTAGRATVLSVTSMVFTVTQLPVLVGIGALGDHASPRMAVAALGVGFLTVTGTVLAFERPTSTSVRAGGDSGD